MEVLNEKIREYSKRLLLSRMRVLMNHGFFGLLLMHMKMGIGNEYPTAWTDGERIWFHPTFIEQLSDDEMDYVLMHELLHVVLKHCMRGKDLQQKRFNIACDIVVNSHILASNNMDKRSITIRCNGGVQMHLAPDGKEGTEYSAEEIYAMLPEMKADQRMKDGGIGWDYHDEWNQDEEEESEMSELWSARIANAVETMLIRDPSNGRGQIPAFAERLVNEQKNAQTDWRTILNEFVQEELCDYSFTPPDRRYDDSPFFLPDFNEKEDVVQDILFMIDTSGSMSNRMISAAYSEVKGAIDQFNGKLKGWLGFFDAKVIKPKEFEDEASFKRIRIFGGGGTSFHAVFEYVNKYMKEKPPVSIIILTDGCAVFPPESMASGIPVLWLINNQNVTPEWGKVARITVD